jgi:hypothetical protein
MTNKFRSLFGNRPRALLQLACVATVASTGCDRVQDALAEAWRRPHQPSNPPNTPPTTPPSTPPTGSPSCANDVASVDEVFRFLLADINSLDADDAPFARYFSLADLVNSGACAPELERARNALAALANSVSREGAIRLPTPVDAGGRLYRVDTRDYGWDRPLQVGTQTFDDAWEAIAAAMPEAVEFTGDQADQVNLFANTTTPLLPIGSFVHTAAQGELYAALLDIPADFGALLDQLEANPTAGSETRGATTAPPFSTHEQRWERRVSDLNGRGVWRFVDLTGDEPSVFQEPLSNQGTSSHVVFPLNNGLFGFAAYESDRRVTEASSLFDSAQPDLVARVATSFFRFYAQGLIPIEDQVLPFALQNPSSYTARTLRGIRTRYRPATENAAQFAADNAAYRGALSKTGVSQASVISDVDQQFSEDLDTRAMAGALSLTLDGFVAIRSRLPRALGADSVSRETFQSVYREALCTFKFAYDNRPARCP